ncbi:MAG: amidohydrolase family protein [Bacteroidia bacterium]|nr:amidohydrolase family protein [Bacteroidia bacterium]
MIFKINSISPALQKLIIGLLFCHGSLTTMAQNPAPAPAQSKSILIKNVQLHDGNGKTYNNASIGFNEGKITFLSYLNMDEKNNSWDSIIDAKGQHVYPGLIALNTNIGLSEIEALRAMNDYSETGSINPNARAIIAYNTDSKVTPTVRFNGILTAQITPSGGLVSGNSSIVSLDAWNWEDAVYKSDEGVHINWPSMNVYYGQKSNEEDFEKKQKERIEKELKNLEAFFEDSYNYHLNNKPNPKNLILESMRGIFDNTKKLYIHANFAKQIMAAVNLCNKYKINFVLVGGSEANMVINLLKDNNIPVILGQTHQLPLREDEPIDAPYTLPKKLQDAGILYALSCNGFWQVRNLPFIAGTAVAYGLTQEQALSSITINAARIAGIDKTTGSIEIGKDATLILCQGDILDMKSSVINRAFIMGKSVSLDNVQHQLYLKYKSKYNID